MEAVITVQAEPAGSAVGGWYHHITSRVGGGGGGGPGGEARIGVIGDSILDCYESLGLGLHYGHAGGGRGCRESGRHSDNVRSHCRIYDDNKD